MVFGCRCHFKGFLQNQWPYLVIWGFANFQNSSVCTYACTVCNQYIYLCCVCVYFQVCLNSTCSDCWFILSLHPMVWWCSQYQPYLVRGRELSNLMSNSFVINYYFFVWVQIELDWNGGDYSKTGKGSSISSKMSQKYVIRYVLLWFNFLNLQANHDWL